MNLLLVDPNVQVSDTTPSE